MFLLLWYCQHSVTVINSIITINQQHLFKTDCLFPCLTSCNWVFTSSSTNWFSSYSCVFHGLLGQAVREASLMWQHKNRKAVVWLDECSVAFMEWVSKRIVQRDSQLGICLCQSSVCDWGSFTLATGCDWQLGQRAVGSFLICFFTRGVLWDLEFMLQYISRIAYGSNVDEKQTQAII